MKFHDGIEGRGVAAAKSFSTGDFVTCYKGEVISHKDALARNIKKYKNHEKMKTTTTSFFK